MTHDWITTLLALGFFAATAAFFVMWSKLEEQKQKTAEAEERRWDEISRAVGLENEIEQLRKQCEAKDYAKQRMYEVNSCLRSDKATLQDKLSALLCPANNHVWKDGVCVKCGRVKDD